MTLNDLVMTYNDSKWLKTPEKQTRDQQTDSDRVALHATKNNGSKKKTGQVLEVAKTYEDYLICMKF